MQAVLLTAVGVGGATIIGSLIGFLFKDLSKKISNTLLSFASGIMLCSAVTGLIIPAIEDGGRLGTVFAVSGILSGTLIMILLEKLVPEIHSLLPSVSDDENTRRVTLFILAIAIHNLPEGIAAGVGFGTGNIDAALLIAGGIALQNLPEGMVLISPMLTAGFSVKKTLLFALFTGAVEVIGTLIGYFAVSISSLILPFALSLAGGTMICIICDEMIPEIKNDGAAEVTISLIVGFCVMLAATYAVG